MTDNQHHKPTSKERVAISDNRRHEWVELTRGQIAQALLDSSNSIELGFKIEQICKENNGYT